MTTPHLVTSPLQIGIAIGTNTDAPVHLILYANIAPNQ
jgi:hypothetical protein